ncbi:MAG: thiol-disulfide oxidoreductase DCC family protein [Chitinophagales bacterium]|jgi:predicted DCC family thiol-disulfide oxidoreductase YuxK|nr:thiol-disulfide oxidoreductase DCC family protein [Chitinophagales bacterium]HPW86748.1 thiol-disulfide oxidoreductase DCC family protein [Chitinophagales bacterium]
MTQLPDKVVLFDGVCNFCESSVQFILRHDKTGSLRFASLQSEIGQQLLTAYGISHELQSVVFVESGKAYTKSAAAFRIARYFGGWWKLLLVFSILPAFITDFGYDIIAKNRYRWFGKKDACMIPSADIRSRFLE